MDSLYYQFLEEIKQEVISTQNLQPINDEYNHMYFISFVQKTALKYNFGSDSVFQGLISEIVFCFLKLNEEYESIMEKIERVLDLLDLTDMILIEKCLLWTNIQFFDVTEIKETDIFGDSRKLSLVSISSPKRKSVWGDEVFLQDAVEVGVDSFNQAVSIIKLHNNGSKTKFYESAIPGIRTLIMLCNISYLLKDIFDQYLCEFKHIFLEDGKIQFIDPTNYGLLKTIGKHRFRSHLLEPSIHMKFKPGIDNSNLLHKISDNTIQFSEHDKSTYQEYQKFQIATIINHKYYLKSTKLKKLGDATISDVYNVVIAIQAALSKLTANEDIRNAIGNGDIKKVPLKINKKNVVKYIQKLTTLKNSVIETILECITSVISEHYDGWRTPIMTYKGQLFFLLGSLENGHTGYLMDVILSRIYEIKKENSIFSAFIRKEIAGDDNNYPITIVDTTTVGDSDFILLALNDKEHVAIQPQIFHFPISLTDYRNAIKQIAHAIIRLDCNISLYLNSNESADKEEYKFVRVVICNYPFLSGIVINGCYIIDSNLLSNYLSTGKYVKGKMTPIDGLKQVGLAAELKYYDSKEQFLNRFVDFIKNPTPIAESYTKFISKKFPIAKQYFSIEIINDDIAEASYSEIENQEIYRLEKLLRNLYYFENEINQDDITAKEQLDLLIQFHLPYVFSIVGFESEDRTVRIELINSIKESGLKGLAYILALLNRLTESTLKKPPKKISDTEETSPINTDQAIDDLRQIMKSLSSNEEVNTLSSINITHSLSEKNRQNLLDYLLTGLDIQLSKEVSLNSLEECYYHLNIIAGLLASKKGYSINFIRAGFNFIDQLNNNFYYQKARNFAEEVLKYYCNKGDSPLIGWLFQMRCFTKQNNIPDAACYAGLLLSVADTYDSLEIDLYFEICYNLMLFHRARGDEDDTKIFFEVLKEITSNEYELHKVHLSYYAGILSTERENLPDRIAEIKHYLLEHLNAILQYNEKGAFPWIILIYNIKNIIKGGLVDDDEFWNTVLIDLEKEISDVELKKWQAIIFSRNNDTTEIFKTALLHTFETTNIEDLVYEIKNISLLAINTIETAIENKDINTLLLSGLVINDQTLTFQLKPWQKYSQFNADVEFELKKYINNYIDFALDRSVIQKGQFIYWIFNHYFDVYCLIIGDETDTIKQLTTWDLEKMRTWLNKSKSFYFPPGQDYFINEQEADYIKALESLKFFELPVVDGCTEILLYYSLDIAAYPHNLLTFDTNKFPKKTFEHEDRVYEKIISIQRDFASLYFPIVNIGSIEWYKNHSNPVCIDCKDYSIELWSPVEDEDFVLSLTLEKTLPVLETLPVKRIVKSVIPDPVPSSNFNIFIAHGGRNFEGFKAVYTRDTGGKAFIKHSGTSALFGNGEVAIVFICNSALTAKEMYAERLISFTNEIILLGYDAVVAPAWSLNPDIVPHWLQAFFENMQKGNSINQAVFLSNMYIAKNGYNEYSGFYAPTGWASMHLYGNPNIYLK